MSTSFCTVCGAVLRDGICPNGHPQRAARRARARRRRKWPWVLALLVLLVAGVAYAGLRWYPIKAAGDLMRPSSEEYSRALQAYRAAMDSAPRRAEDPQVVIQASAAVSGPVEAARTELSQAQLALEDRTTPLIPVVSEQPPLAEAVDLRAQMLRLYPVALEALGQVESLAGYVTELARTLPQLQNVESALRKAGPGELGDAIAVARPVAGQLSADLVAITPPEEVGAAHAALQAIAEQIVANLEEASQAGGQAAEPVIRALVKDVIREVRDFRETLAAAPGAAVRAGLGDLRKQVDRLAERIEAGLVGLRDRGVEGISLMEED